MKIDQLDQIAAPSIIPSASDQIVIIEEIGKIECFSPLFRQTLTRTLNSENLVVGSISLKGGPFIQKIKEREDVLLVTVSETNKDSLAADLSKPIPT